MACTYILTQIDMVLLGEQDSPIDVDDPSVMKQLEAAYQAGVEALLLLPAQNAEAAEAAIEEEGDAAIEQEKKADKEVEFDSESSEDEDVPPPFSLEKLKAMKAIREAKLNEIKAIGAKKCIEKGSYLAKSEQLTKMIKEGGRAAREHRKYQRRQKGKGLKVHDFM